MGCCNEVRNSDLTVFLTTANSKGLLLFADRELRRPMRGGQNEDRGERFVLHPAAAWPAFLSLILTLLFRSHTNTRIRNLGLIVAYRPFSGGAR
jgi:hypothetical protein